MSDQDKAEAKNTDLDSTIPAEDAAGDQQQQQQQHSSTVSEESKTSTVKAEATNTDSVSPNQTEGENQQHDKSTKRSRREEKSIKSRSRAAGSRRTRSSASSSSLSVVLKAKKAALLAEASTLQERENLEKQRLQLEHQTKRLDIKTEILKVEAEQQVLEEEDEEESPSEQDPSEHNLSETRGKRTEAWVKQQVLNPLAESFKPQQLDNDQPQQLEDNQNCHQEVDAKVQQAERKESGPITQQQQETASPIGSGDALEGLVKALQMPKVELSMYDGDPIYYYTFMRAFENNVGKLPIADDAKLARLLQYCTGRAKKVIEGCAALPTGQGYQRALQLLQERCGDNYLIVSSWVNRVTTSHRLSTEGLQDFADELTNMNQTLTALAALSEINQQTLLRIVERLPLYLQRKWRTHAARLRETLVTPALGHLVNFVSLAAREVADPVYGGLGVGASKKPTEQPKKGFHGVTAAATLDASQTHTSQSPTAQCPVCDQKGCVSLFRCEKFKALSPQQRLETARRQRLCFNCLKTGHSAGGCKIESTCKAPGCKLKHTKFLHVDNNQGAATAANDQKKIASTDSNQKNAGAAASTQRDIATGSNQKKMPAPSPAAAVSCCARPTPARVALPVVKVKVKVSNGRSLQAFALLDSGSTSSFCSTSLLRELGSRGRATNLHLTTLESSRTEVKTAIHDLSISDLQGKQSIDVTVYEVSSVPVSPQCTVSMANVSSWAHLQGLDIPVPENEEIHMLIGQDCPDVLMPLETRRAEVPNAPYATRTLFGWTVSGPLGETRDDAATVHCVSLTPLEEQVANFWKMEGVQHTGKDKGMSLEDQQALQHMQKTTQLEDGHYTVGIPFRETDPELPNNREIAEQRLYGLRHRLERNTELKNAYQDSMAALIHKGHAEVVPDDTSPKAEWYIPHHAVVNPRKKKIRVVFDCGSKHHGTSLNEQVLQGPDLTRGLLGILLRFREHRVALAADIEGMFLQVKVPTEDRDVLRFLWWPDGNTSEPPETYRMTSHLFGGTWSPSVCAYALQRTAEDNAAEFDANLVKTVQQDFYVDDCLKSVQQEAEAISIATELPSLLQKGGFRLHKWLSNSREVLQTIPEEDRAVGVQQLNLQALPTERTLGVLWDSNSDTLTFDRKLPNKPCTRRGVLSTVTSIYDPMGFLSPFTVRGKVLVQQLTREGMDWDEPLTGDSLESWKEWRTESEDVSEIHTDRCLQTSCFEPIHTAELHHFADASTLAYGAVSYIRLVDVKGQVRVSLILSRSRVAPIKTATVPRLELAAATMAVQLDGMLRRELSIPIAGSTFYTDSTIVLAYIRNERKRFHTYVANRLAIIHSGSSVNQWRHINSEENPADDLSRGLSLRNLITQERWWYGPEFLSRQTLPDQEELPETSIDDDPEVKRTSSTVHAARASQEDPDVLDDLFKRYSSWEKLRRAVAWLLRLKDYLRNKAKEAKGMKPDDTDTGKGLTVRELQRAETAVIQVVQRQEYAEELRALNSPDARVKQTSKIYTLDPALTSQGIIICRMRARHTDYPSEPAILPRDHHISTLIAAHHHAQTGHAGREATACQVLQRYWISGIRTLVKQMIKKCRQCRRLHSAPMGQRMADLPKERVSPDEPPFTHVGLDCFGPFLTKVGRRQMKNYGCIFTCLTMRAVHLEVLDSMDTSSFVNALQRFLSRRGSPKTLVSDQGTNFTGAERELRESMQQVDFDYVETFLSKRAVQWKFNPAGASHMGGAWERLIRSVRKTLRSIMEEQVTSADTLSTLMCLTEGIVNSRPLTPVSEDPKDLEALTPNHLLLLRPTPQLPPGVFDKKDCYVRRRWRQVQYLADLFWHRWQREYLPLIQLRPKWREQKDNLKVGDIVLVVDYGMPRNQWTMGRVTAVKTGADGLVRSAEIRTRTASITRPIHKLCFLEGQN